MDEELYNPLWDGASEPARPYTGFFGLHGQGKSILADTEGFFGFSMGKATNAILDIRYPERGTDQVKDLIVTITYPGQPEPEIITYNSAYVYERSFPENTTVTMTTSGGQYKETTQTFFIPGGTVISVVLQLMFNQAYALVSRLNWA